MIATQANGITPKSTHQFLDRIFGEDIHAKRTPDAGLAEARAALQIVGTIYEKSGLKNL